jgi:NADH-quinone oxidoreductase subunit A
MLNGYYNTFWFLIIGVAFVIVNLWISSLIRPSDPAAEKLLPYECGEESSGTGFMRFNPRFYVIGLVFLIFDIETVFIFPWAVVLKGAGVFVLIEMVIFLGILVVGLAYAWGRGDLEWIRQPTRWQPLWEQLASRERSVTSAVASYTTKN